MLLAPKAKRVLVLGGCPGGAVDEILKYPEVTKVTCVELDPALFTFADRFLVLRISGDQLSLHSTCLRYRRKGPLVASVLRAVSTHADERADSTICRFP